MQFDRLVRTIHYLNKSQSVPNKVDMCSMKIIVGMFRHIF